MLDAYPLNVPNIDNISLFLLYQNKRISQLTTESRTGKNILAVLRFDVTSVKSPLIIIINKITAPRGTPPRNRSARATLNDNFEALENKNKFKRFYIFFKNEQT